MTSRLLLPTLLVLGAVATTSAQTVSLTLRDGRVTLITQNATPAAILAEWARQGQTRVVDAERIPGTPLTLRLENVGEREALDIVLRGAAGYVAAPRTQATAAQSRFDRIIVMATSPGAGAARAASGRPAPVVVPQAITMPAQVEEEAATAQQAATVQDEVGPTVINGVEQPASSTNFDYANPQRYFAGRQAEQQAAADAAAPATGTQPTPGPFGPTRSTPGLLPIPAAPNQPGGAAGTVPVNPYGLPANQSPGSSQAAPQLEPDRSKYINPYSPTRRHDRQTTSDGLMQDNTLAAQVNAALSVALRARDQETLDTLRLLKAALTNKRVELTREPDDPRLAGQVVDGKAVNDRVRARLGTS